MVWSRPMPQLSPGNHFVPRWRKMMLPGITYCSVDLLLVFCFVLPSGLCVWQRDVVGEVEVGKKVVCVGLWVMKYHIPPLFLAPNLFPAPSFAELAAPWALCEAWRTPMEVVELARAGVDRRKALRAVSMVAMAGEEPVGSARILGSNMVRAVCVLALVQKVGFDGRFAVALSTFDFLPPPQLCWEQDFTLATTWILIIHALASFLRNQHHITELNRRQGTLVFAIYCIESTSVIDHHLSHPSTAARYLARPSARPTPPLPCVLSTD
jgi:hypothetical protein